MKTKEECKDEAATRVNSMLVKSWAELCTNYYEGFIGSKILNIVVDDAMEIYADQFRQPNVKLPLVEIATRHYCGDCGEELTEVRPGKHQCDNGGCESNLRND